MACHAANTGSCFIFEVKQHRATLVLGYLEGFVHADFSLSPVHLTMKRSYCVLDRVIVSLLGVIETMSYLHVLLLYVLLAMGTEIA